MANQTLKKDNKTEKKEQAAVKHFVTLYKFTVDRSKPLTAQCLRVDGSTVIRTVHCDTSNIDLETRKHVRKSKNKITGFTEKINPFAGKPYVAPKAIQDKIEEVKQLLKGSPIPEEFLK